MNLHLDKGALRRAVEKSIRMILASLKEIGRSLYSPVRSSHAHLRDVLCLSSND